MKTHHHHYLIAIGSNLGDRLEFWRQACIRLDHDCGAIIGISSVYETEPMGNADQAFYNGALVLESPLPPPDLLTKLQKIEADLGRERSVHWGNRTIDLDILLWKEPDDLKSGEWSSAHLQIPHPEMLHRNFVLIPAAEVAPDWCLPHSDCQLVAHVHARKWQGSLHPIPDLLRSRGLNPIPLRTAPGNDQPQSLSPKFTPTLRA